MKVGLALPHYDCSFPDGRAASMRDVVAYAVRAEQLGFDSVWVSDHLFLDLAKYGGPARRYGTPEAFAMLTAIAAATSRVRIGSLVLCAPFRNARLALAQASSIQDASGGRLELGLGAGWYEPEFIDAHIEFGTTASRIAHLAGYASALHGHGFPTWIGGKGGPKIARIVAESADGWNVVWRMTPEDYRARLDVLGEACAQVGRDPDSVRRSIGFYTLLGTSDADLAHRYTSLQSFIPGILDDLSLDAFARGALTGTADVCAQKVKEFSTLGVEEIILAFAPTPFGVYDDEQLELAAELISAVT